MKRRFAIALAFALTVVASGGAPAQETSPMPAQSGMPPMMSPQECAAMQSAMQKNMKSPSDMAMMQAMMTMHHTMMQTPMTGDPDRDFLAMMIPHHQSAVDAAKIELRDGKDPQVRALAQRIVKAQEAEIRQMRAWLAKP